MTPPPILGNSRYWRLQTRREERRKKSNIDESKPIIFRKKKASILSSSKAGIINVKGGSQLSRCWKLVPIELAPVHFTRPKLITPGDPRILRSIEESELKKKRETLPPSRTVLNSIKNKPKVLPPTLGKTIKFLQDPDIRDKILSQRKLKKLDQLFGVTPEPSVTPQVN